MIKQLIYGGRRILNIDADNKEILVHVYIYYTAEDPLGISEGSEVIYAPEPLSKRHKVGGVYWVEKNDAGRWRSIEKSVQRLHVDTVSILQNLDKIHWTQYKINRMPMLIRLFGITAWEKTALAYAMPKDLRYDYIKALMKVED